jgi:hypothetical protein
VTAAPPTLLIFWTKQILKRAEFGVDAAEPSCDFKLSHIAFC